jgi:hypothetical protein
MSSEATSLDQTSKSRIGPSREAWIWTGRALSGITIFFMLFDAGGKLSLESHVIDVTTMIGGAVASKIRTEDPLGAAYIFETNVSELSFLSGASQMIAHIKHGEFGGCHVVSGLHR